VEHGFVVAIPTHAKDSFLDASEPGPASWRRRPLEVSRAIDQVGLDQSLSPLLRLDAVGVFGGSAGGHTALTLAGGEWSETRFRDHCLQHIEEDFSSCVGFATLLRGNWFDSVKLWAARVIIRWRFDDATPQRHTDSRVRAAVAMVPFAADFSADSLRNPSISLGLIVADRDVNQIPRFHVGAIQKACEPRCTVLAHLQEAGHGAMLSPLPPFKPGSIADYLLSDPPSFDRVATVPRVHAAIASFFLRELAAQ
jgi:predicted dienelactone hydrolase